MLSKKTTCKHEHLEPVLGGYICLECSQFITQKTMQGYATQQAVVDITAVLHAILPRLVRLEHEFEQMDPILQELVLKDLNYSRCSTLDCRAFFPKDPGNLVGGLPYCDLCYPAKHARFMAGQETAGKRIQKALTSIAQCRRCKGTFSPAKMNYHDAWEYLCPQCNDIVLGKKAITTTEREFGELGVALERPATFVTGPEDDDGKMGIEQPHITAEAVRKTAAQLLSTDIPDIEEPRLACSTWGCQNSFPNNGGNEIDGKRLCDRCYEKELGNVECRSAPMWAWDIIDECLGLDAVSNASDKELRDSVQRAIDAMTVETAWNSNVAGKES